MRKQEAAPEEEGVDWADDRAQKDVDLGLVYQAIRTVRGQIGEWKVQQRLASAGIQGGPRADACARELGICDQRLRILTELAAEVKASETGLDPKSRRIVVPRYDLTAMEQAADGRR